MEKPKGREKFKEIEPVTRLATSAVIADRIRSAIINGPFASGDQLTETQLAEALGVSRGPVREALQRLIQEGLLRSEPNRGVFVMRLDEEDLTDIYFARTTVERAAVLRLLDTIDEAALEELRHCVEEMRRAAAEGDAAGVADGDLRFHTTLTDAAGSKRLTRMFETLITETRMALTAGRRELQLDTSVIDEHVALLDALQARDRRRTLALVDKHMGSGLRRRMGEAQASRLPGEDPAP